MKKFSFVISTVALMIASATQAYAVNYQVKDLTAQIPEIYVAKLKGYDKVADVAHFGEADWSNVIGIAKGITLQEAKKIADRNPKITYFFHMKGHRMVLNAKEGGVRSFGHGDTVFFTGKPHWGEAKGYADGYVKQAK